MDWHGTAVFNLSGDDFLVSSLNRSVRECERVFVVSQGRSEEGKKGLDNIICTPWENTLKVSRGEVTL